MVFGNRWPCCGVLYVDSLRRGSLGCISADHREIDMPFGPEDAAILPIQIAQNMGISSKSLRHDVRPPDGNVRISRCDFNLHLVQKNTSDNVIFNYMSKQ